MILSSIPHIECIWSEIHSLYDQFENGLLEADDLEISISHLCKNFTKLSDKEIITEASDFLKTSETLLQKLLCLSLLDITAFRRLLACKELSTHVKCNYPQQLKYTVVGLKYGFSPETVRKFYTRYPSYFNCQSVYQLLES